MTGLKGKESSKPCFIHGPRLRNFKPDPTSNTGAKTQASFPPCLTYKPCQFTFQKSLHSEPISVSLDCSFEFKNQFLA